MHGKCTAFTLALEQPTVCGLLHITSSLRDACQVCPYEKQKYHQQQQKIIQQPEMTPQRGIFDPLVLSKQSQKSVSVLCTGEACSSRAKYHRNTPAWLCAERILTVTAISSLLQNTTCCPCAPPKHLFSIFRFNFTNKTHICWKSHYILCLQGYCIQGFLLPYQRRLLNDKYSFLRLF